MNIDKLRKWRDLLSILIAVAKDKGFNLDVKISTELDGTPFLRIFIREELVK